MARQQYAFDAIGTHWRISFETGRGETGANDLWRQIAERIAQFDQAYSRFRDDSLVARISRQAGRYGLPPDGPKLVSFYEQLYRATDGLVTPLIGQVVSDAGYDAAYSFKKRPLSRPPAWDEVISLHDQELEVKQPVLLDFGAAGKGYLVDIVGQLLAENGVATFIIDAGGDILRRDPSGHGIRIGLENPLDTSQAVGVASLADGSICASSSSRRKWGNYHHIISPETLASPRDVIAAWVMAGDAMTADGLATALFLVEPGRLLRHFTFEHALLRHGMNMSRSARFPARFFEKAKR